MKYFFAYACTILFFSSSFGQIILTQTHNEATIGLDRKAFNGLGNTASDHSDGYAHDFTLPASTNPCQVITATWSPALNNITNTEYTFTPDAVQCASNQAMTIVINSNGAPVISEVTTSGFDIEIFTTPTGDFSYSIDGQNFQYGNIFYVVPGGRYTITVRDDFGCGQDIISHLHFVIPKFFTLNIR